jgi:transcriptional antiterminator Rof (Rho-off)
VQVLELEQHVHLRKMTYRIEISKFDIKASQVMTWAFTLLLLLASTGIVFSSFTLNGFYVILLILFITTIINYASAKMWNIWYENGFIIMQNLYSTKKVEVSQFGKIEMTSVFNNGYTLDMKNGEKYQFKITPTEDLKLFFKSDPQFYAKQMTERLNEIKSQFPPRWS